MEPRSSFAASDTTYHSFNDIELHEPPSPPRGIRPRDSTGQPSPPPMAVKMQRQDSGYESHQSGSARNSISRRMSVGSSASGALATRTRTRPSTHRSAKSYPQAYSRGSTSHQPAVYFQFPTPELTEAVSQRDAAPLHSPPATTHYWTSDSTRRLEYAAIDAASRGVKGWIRRHLVPDCFTPRHVAFDDDSGSVRRYRLELDDDDDDDEKYASPGAQRRRWNPFSLRKSSTA